MNKASRVAAGKKATNISLPSGLVDEAKQLGINLSQACEAGLLDQVRKARREKWLQENREALDWSNDYVENHGLPLARYRMF